MQAEKCGIVLDFDRQYSAHTASTRTAAVRGYTIPQHGGTQRSSPQT